MKFAWTIFLLAVAGASLALPQSSTATKKSKTAPKTAPAKTSAKTTTTKKGVASKTGTSTSASSKKGRTTKHTAPVSPTAARSRQMTPSPERYKEIQQALVDKGYLKSDATGVWDSQSADALRQFQTEKNLSPTGKLSSASLIALGLGPRTDSSVTSGSVPIPPPPAPDN